MNKLKIVFNPCGNKLIDEFIYKCDEFDSELLNDKESIVVKKNSELDENTNVYNYLQTWIKLIKSQKDENL